MNDDKTVIRRPIRAPSADGDNLQAYLIVLCGRSVGKMTKIPVGVSKIGRSLQADIRLDDEGVSRLHAAIDHQEDRGAVLNDLESTNGTYVNGVPVRSHELQDGDRIQVGSVTILKFSYQDSLEEQFQQQLYESATRDALTHAYNKRFFDDRLDKEISHSSRHGSPLSLILFDVDHFKRINDTYGHPSGDHVLQRLSAVVIGSLRNEDTYCRVGGEEFAILARSDFEETMRLAERLRSLVEDTRFTFGGETLPVTLSFGVAEYDPSRHGDGQALVAEVDGLLYDAKHSGRNRVCGSGFASSG